VNFWDIHGWIFLVAIALFPRITMLVAVSSPFGWLAWLGWAFAPHLTVAILATMYYWHSNPVLCVVSWLFAFAGTGGECVATLSAVHSRAEPTSQRTVQPI
jgi:hypothetical protein